MLNLRYHAVIKNKLHFPVITRCYTSITKDKKSSTKHLQPVKSIEDKDGITEVYIVRRLKSGKLEQVKSKASNNPSLPKKKAPLSQRLNQITTDSKNDNNPPDLKNDNNPPDPKWTQIPREAQYKRKLI